MDKKNEEDEIRQARADYEKTRAVMLDAGFLNDPARKERRRRVRGVMADYGRMPRLTDDPGLRGAYDSDTRVDIAQLVTHCEDLGVNCFEFLIGGRSTDWDDFKEFVILAEKSTVLSSRGFTVWIYLVPPAEYAQLPMEPFKMDYVRWMSEIAAFSKKHPGVTAVCIDDFYDSGKLFTYDYLTRMRVAADEYNPGLALVGVYYWGEVNPEREARIYKAAAIAGTFMDGILYPFMDQSSSPRGRGMNHHNTGTLPYELQRVKEIYPHVPLVVDIYVSKHSKSPDEATPEYVRDMIELARETADGVACYGGPKKNKDGTFPERWQKSMHDPAGVFDVVSRSFRTGWRGKQA